MAKKIVAAKALAHRERLQQDAFGRLSVAVNDYLESVGWRALVVGDPQVRGFERRDVGNFEFTVRFTGGRLRAKAK